jgi:hypothetical protein
MMSLEELLKKWSASCSDTLRLYAHHLLLLLLIAACWVESSALEWWVPDTFA